MSAAVLEVDDELERCAVFSAEVVGFEVRSEARTRLETRTIAGRLSTEADLVGRTSAQGLMGPRGIVPGGVDNELSAHQLEAHGHQDASQGLVK